MPELNGLQLLSCVKQDANLRAVPVVSECSAPPLPQAPGLALAADLWLLPLCWRTRGAQRAWLPLPPLQ